MTIGVWKPPAPNGPTLVGRLVNGEPEGSTSNSTRTRYPSESVPAWARRMMPLSALPPGGTVAPVRDALWVRAVARETVLWSTAKSMADSELFPKETQMDARPVELSPRARQ